MAVRKIRESSAVRIPNGTDVVVQEADDEKFGKVVDYTEDDMYVVETEDGEEVVAGSYRVSRKNESVVTESSDSGPTDIDSVVDYAIDKVKKEILSIKGSKIKSVEVDDVSWGDRQFSFDVLGFDRKGSPVSQDRFSASIDFDDCDSESMDDALYVVDGKIEDFAYNFVKSPIRPSDDVLKMHSKVKESSESTNPKKWPNNKTLTYREAQKLALAYYNQGGDSFYECWDEKEFNEFIEIEGHPMTVGGMKSMFNMYDEVDRDMRGSGQFQESFVSPVDAAEYYYSTSMDDREIENDLKSTGHDDKFVKDVLRHMDEIFDEEERNNTMSRRFNESAQSYRLADYSMKDIKNVLDNALKSASQITVVYKDGLAGRSYLSYKRDGDSWTFVNEKGQVMNRGTQNEKSSTGLSKNYVYRNLVYVLNNKNVVELKIQESLKESGSDEEVTVGIYGDEVPKFSSFDEIVSYFDKKGIKVLEKSGDIDTGWDLTLRGKPRQLFFAIVNVIPGYHSDSVQEFIDQYRIDESLKEGYVRVRYKDEEFGHKQFSLVRTSLEAMKKALDKYAVDKEDIISVEGCEIDDLFESLTESSKLSGPEREALIKERNMLYKRQSEMDAEILEKGFEACMHLKDEWHETSRRIGEINMMLNPWKLMGPIESLVESDEIESSGAKEFVITLTVKMEKYDNDEPAEFDFNADTNDVGEVVLTPVDLNTHFVSVQVQKK